MIDGINSVGHVYSAQGVENAKNVKTNCKVDLSDPVDTAVFATKAVAEKPEASTGKKIGVGVGSAILPGFGQLINGEGRKAAGHFFGNLGLRVAAGMFAFSCPPLAVACSIGALVLGIGSIVDAVKNA